MSITNLPKANARPGSLVASAKSWCLMVKSPITRLSFETKPSMEPEPYWIEKLDPLALCVDEDCESYLVWRKQAMEVHLTLGTHKLLDLTDTLVTSFCSVALDFTLCRG